MELHCSAASLWQTLVAVLLIDAAGQESPIHDQRLAGDEGCRIGGKIDGCSDKLLGAPEAPHGSAQQQLLTAWSTVEQSCIQLCAEDAGRNRIDSDAFA